MSRIDEALRRTGQQTPQRTFGDGQGVFVSAWGAEDVPPAAPRPEAPAIRAVRHTVQPEAPAAGQGRQTAVALNRAWKERLATTPEANSVLVEQFRRLAATLHNAQNGSGVRILMVTSASPDDGKTLTAVNLALVLSESYNRRVLLIDADLRRPSLGNVADVTDAPGLSDALKAATEQKLAILEVTPTLWLLPAGRPDPDPIGGLTSPRMQHILEEAAGRFDWVILDAPPLAPMADANLLAKMVDGALFVVRAGRTPHAAVHAAIGSLGRERILGVVLNGVEDMPVEQYAYAYAGAADQPQKGT